MHVSAKDFTEPIDSMVMKVVLDELKDPYRHTRFAVARKGHVLGIFRKPVTNPCGLCDGRCIAGMIRYAESQVSLNFFQRGEDAESVRKARDRIEYLFECEAQRRGYKGMRSLNDYGGYWKVREAADAVAQRL